jgi:hypothetical protein
VSRGSDIENNYFYHLVDDFLSLNQAIEDIRQRVASMSDATYTSQDARQLVLEGMQCDIAACGNWMRALMSLKGLSQEKYGSEWDEEYRKILGTGLSSDQAEYVMLEYLRNTLATKIHFKVENLFSNILKVLAATPARRNFCHIKNAMLEQAGIPLKGPEDDILMVLAELRNSYHNNGMSEGSALSCVVGGLTFEFSEGQPVQCASWDHIVVIMRATIGVLAAILFSERVSDTRGEIPDAFAAQATLPM